MYNQDLATQELAVQAGGGGGNAEMQAGGVVMNIIPKEGGNVFSGQGYVGHTAGGWIADNYSQRLQEAGTTPSPPASTSCSTTPGRSAGRSSGTGSGSTSRSATGAPGPRSRAGCSMTGSQFINE